MRRPILVVDDNPDDLELTVLACGQTSLAGRVVTASGGEEALALLLGPNPPEGVLLDIMMPGMDGLEVLARLSESPRRSETVVAVLTSSWEERDRARARELGADLYLRKPARFEELVDAVRQFESRLALKPSSRR